MIFMTEAVRLGDMSVVSPFRYTRLLFSMAAGILILGEQVNAMMLVGSALTILSGLYIWHRNFVSTVSNPQIYLNLKSVKRGLEPDTFEPQTLVQASLQVRF